jgi:hypothetical protein
MARESKKEGLKTRDQESIDRFEAEGGMPRHNDEEQARGTKPGQDDIERGRERGQARSDETIPPRDPGRVSSDIDQVTPRSDHLMRDAFED